MFHDRFMVHAEPVTKHIQLHFEIGVRPVIAITDLEFFGKDELSIPKYEYFLITIHDAFLSTTSKAIRMANLPYAARPTLLMFEIHSLFLPHFPRVRDKMLMVSIVES
jgi:hypothetical protein